MSDKSKIEHIASLRTTSEKVIERYLCRRVAALGLLCLKYANFQQAGYPDRLILLPGSRCLWVELKSTGHKPTRLQQERFDDLLRHGHRVYVLDTHKKIDLFLEMIKVECI